MSTSLNMEFGESLEGLSGIKHGFFNRNGGVSDSIYNSLNPGLGSHDNRAHVLENRKRIAASFGVSREKLFSVNQYHSNHVVIADTPLATPPKADAIVTKKPGLMISVMSADCAPVLFYDPKNRVIGASHAGWRGAIGGICEATVATMIKQGADASYIRAAIGPCLGPCHFEVGPEFVEQFISDSPANTPFFRAGANDRAYFDIKAYLKNNLEALGIKLVSAHPHCTYAQPEQYFSYRYNTHKGISDYGRNISAIMLDS